MTNNFEIAWFKFSKPTKICQTTKSKFSPTIPHNIWYIHTYTPVMPYIKEIYRLINLISDCHTVVRRIFRYPYPDIDLINASFVSIIL